MKTLNFYRSAPVAVVFVLGLLASAAGTAASPLSIFEAQPTPATEVMPPLWAAASDDGISVVIHLPKAHGSHGEVLVTEQPRHGGIEVEPGVILYYPAENRFTGRDSLTVSMNGVELRYELRILPRRLPFAGRFDGIYQAAALWDNFSQAFLLCGEPAEGERDLPCKRVPVLWLGSGPFIPLAWPDDDGSERPVLFDPAAGRFLHLERSGSHFRISQTVEIPASRNAWPIFGDWHEEGRLELALVGDDGTVFQDGKGLEAWPQSFELPAKDELMWPILLPREGRDAIGLVEASSCDVRWLQLDEAEGAISDVEPSYIGDECRRPLSWLMSPVSHLLPGLEIFFLQPGDELLLVPGKYKASKPQTIPVKFPDDPPGG